MKINRIHLKNFAGVKESEVCFASTGVTVVVGPNEIGKSSLFQALDLLLEPSHQVQPGCLCKLGPEALPLSDPLGALLALAPGVSQGR